LKAAILIAAPKKNTPVWYLFAIYCNFLKIIFVVLGYGKRYLEQSSVSICMLCNYPEIFNAKETLSKNYCIPENRNLTITASPGI